MRSQSDHNTGLRCAIVIALLAAVCALFAPAARATTYYIDYVSGSNSNPGTSEATPWKTHPWMQHGSPCDSGAPTYTHQAGDNFIFKGGVTWPLSCFRISIKAGGTSTAQDYHGVCVSNSDFANESNLPIGAINESPCATGTSWPSSGWTRPVFGGGGTTPAQFPAIFYNVNLNSGCSVAMSIGYFTIDNIEIPSFDEGVSVSTCYPTAIAAGGTFPGTQATGSVVENMYIHDYVSLENSDSNCNNNSLGCPAYGSIYGAATARYNVISDQNGFYTVGGNHVNDTMSGGLENVNAGYGNHIFYAWVGCEHVFSCHDNQFDHIAGGTGINIHTHILYDDGSFQSAFYAYNNLVHDSQPGIVLSMFYESFIFNNVFYNNSQATIALQQCPPGHLPVRR